MFSILTLGEKYKAITEKNYAYEEANPFYFWYKNYKALEDLSHEVIDNLGSQDFYSIVTERIDTKCNPTIYVYTVIVKKEVIIEDIAVPIRIKFTFNPDKGLYTISSKAYRSIGTSIKEALVEFESNFNKNFSKNK
jgi:hypothetical protein